MPRTNVLEATFRIVTPLFLGGAKPNDCAELREASIKGALRFWYRAADPNYRQEEARIFGGTARGTDRRCFC
jgi:CRISPR-associated protein Cmr1